MIGSIAAEFRKVRQRPALLVSLLVIVGIIALVYLVSYIQALNPGSSPRGNISFSTLYPAAFVTTVIGIVPTLIGAIAVVLGALIVGTEFQWNTIKTQLIQGPGRLTTLFAKFVIIALWMALLAVAFYGTAAAGSVAAALLQHQSITWPALSMIGQALAATWLIAFCYAMLGAGLAFVFRQSAAALGVGLVYVIVIQTILVGVFGNLFSGDYKWVTKLFDSQNASSLTDSFLGSHQGAAALVGPTQAVLVLTAYIAIFAAVSGVLARRRDIA
jgi:ABC-type transport system involved in multi-copper enzyme maturation permease subunit